MPSYSKKAMHTQVNRQIYIFYPIIMQVQKYKRQMCVYAGGKEREREMLHLLSLEKLECNPKLT